MTGVDEVEQKCRICLFCTICTKTAPISAIQVPLDNYIFIGSESICKNNSIRQKRVLFFFS